MSGGRWTAALLVVGAIATGCSGDAVSSTTASRDPATSDGAPSTSSSTTSTTTPSTTSTAESPTTTEAPATTTTEGALGSFDQPAPVNSTAEFSEWDVTYLGSRIGTDEVLEENQFNDPPEDGYEFVFIEIQATYTGPESGDFWIDFITSIVGGQGNTFDESCGVIPNDITDTGETFPGGTVTGYECVAAPVDQFEGAKVSVEEFTFVNEQRVFFELGITG